MRGGQAEQGGEKVQDSRQGSSRQPLKTTYKALIDMGKPWRRKKFKNQGLRLLPAAMDGNGARLKWSSPEGRTGADSRFFLYSS